MASNELLDSNIYSQFETDLYARRFDPVSTDPDQENPNPTFGEIFDPNPLEKKAFSEMHFLNQLINGDPLVINDLVKDTGIMQPAIQQLAQREFEKYGGIQRLRELNEYANQYTVQETTPESPPQRIESTPVGETMVRPLTSYRRGMGPPLLTDDVELLEQRRKEMEGEPVRPLTPEEKIVLQRGGDITTDYYTMQNLDASDRYFGEQGFHAFPNINSPSLMKGLVSLTYPTKEEAYELVKDEDPDAEFSYIDPRDVTRGLLVRSPKTNGQLVPWKASIGSGLFSSADETFRTMPEALKGPMLDGFTETMFRDLMPELFAGGAALGIGGLIRKGNKEVQKELAKRGPEAALEALKETTLGTKAVKGLRNVAVGAAVIGIPVGLARFAQLSYARAEGIHPTLTADRMAEDAGLVGAMAAAGGVGGEIVMRSMQNVYRRLVGKNIPDEVVQRIQLRVEQLRQRTEKPDTAQYSRAEIDKVLEPFAQATGREYSKLKTLGELTDDEILQQLEADLLRGLSERTDSKIAIEQMLLERGSTLQNFYESMLNNSGANRKNMPSYRQFKEHFEAIARQQKEAALAAEKASLAEMTPVSVLGEGQAVTEVAETVAEQLPTSAVFPDSRAVLFLQRDAAFRDAQDQLTGVLASEEAQNLTTTSLDKHIGPTVQKFLSGKNAPIKSMEEAEASGVLRDLIPMRDGQSIIKNLLGVRERNELGQFIARPQFTLEDLVNARVNVQSLESSPNAALREYASELKLGFDEAITALTRNNPELKNKLTTALANSAAVRDEVIDGKYLLSIINSENYQEVAGKMLGGSPANARKLFSMLRTRDLEEGTPGFREEEVRASVLQYLRKEIQGGDPPEFTVAQQNKKFREFLNNNGDQLAEIFPEEDIVRFKSFANFSKAAEADIKAGEARASRLYKELQNFKAKPFEIVSRYLKADKSNLEEQGVLDEMQRLSDLADEYPELRESLQGVFSDYLRRAMQGVDYGEFFPGQTIFQPDAFNAGALLNLVSGKGGGKQATKELTDEFSLLLGKDMAKDYARNLQILEREVRRIRDRQYKKGLLGGADSVLSLGDEAQTGIKTVMRFIIPPLTQAGRRAGATVSLLGNQTQRYLLEVLSDPAKTAELVAMKDKQMSQREFAKVLGLLALNPSTEIGGMRQEDPYDRGVRVIKEASPEKVRDIFGIELADGGSVNSALAQAEARNAELRRSRG